MKLANSSLLDEATAAAEAMTMCSALARGKKPKFLVSVSPFLGISKPPASDSDPAGNPAATGPSAFSSSSRIYTSPGYH